MVWLKVIMAIVCLGISLLAFIESDRFPHAIYLLPLILFVSWVAGEVYKKVKAKQENSSLQ